jgi:polyferredoxin
VKKNIIILCVILLTAGLAFPEARFPAPEFDSGYVIPSPTAPLPGGDYRGYIDLSLLVIALSFASWLLLKKRSRKGIYILSVLSLIYFGFIRHGCICVVGSLQNVTMALFDSSYGIPFILVAYFMLPLIFALFFGRVFCGAVCPLGMIQDMVALKPIKVAGWLEHVLGLIPYFYFGLAVLFAATGAGFIICQYDPFVAFFRLSGSFNMLLLGALFLLVGIFIARPYCRYLCPYSVLLRWTSFFSKYKVSITPDDCIQCRLCEDACPYGAINKPLPEHLPEAKDVGISRLKKLLVMFPLIVICGGIVGYLMHVSLSTTHPLVSLAEQVALEDNGLTTVTTLASEAFRESGQTVDDLYGSALLIRNKFKLGSTLLGIWLGIVIGGKLLLLSVYRSRKDYEPDRATCLSCGRCYASCPK